MGVLAQPINALAEGYNNFVSGVGGFFENLIESLGSWFEDVGEFFDNIITSLGRWFDDVIDGIVTLGNDISLWFQGIGDKITQFADNFSNTMSKFMSYLDPTSDNFFLKAAFIPSQDYMINYAKELNEALDKKMGFITEIREFLGNIFGGKIEAEPEPPKFEITLPGGKWGQGKIEIIDLSIFARYRLFILNFMRVLLWIPFMMKLYRRLPQLVYK